MTCLLCDSKDVVSFACVDTQRYFRCNVCRLIWLDPSQFPDAQTERQHYDLHDNDIHDVNYRAFLRRLAHPLLERLAPASYGLDYGCGPGPALAEMLSEAGHAMEIYDPVYANDEDVLEEQYDFITCTEVVEHFHRPAEEFARLMKMVKPGGWLAVMTQWLDENIDFSHWYYRRDPTHVCFYQPHTFKHLCHAKAWCVEFPDTNIALLQRNTVK